MISADFTWRDGERTIRFGRGALRDAGQLLRSGYVVVTTERAAGMAPEVVRAAAATFEVPSGPVDRLAGALAGELPRDGRLLVAIGGGRVTDTAKAVAAAHGGRQVAAIPTTLSAAEMTGFHRQAVGAVAGAPQVRPALVLNDPVLSASQPEADLAASAANSLAHAVEAPVTEGVSPVPSLAAREAVGLTAQAYAGEAVDRSLLALAALLSGYAIGSTGFGLHHVLAQTLARAGGVPHRFANAALLPHTIGALGRRSPDRGDPCLEPLARDLAARAGAARLRDLAVEQKSLRKCADAAAVRVDSLARTPPPADATEILEIYHAAW